MRRKLSRFLTTLAWMATPSDWVFFGLGTFERAIYEALRRADIDHDRLAQRLRWDRIDALATKGNPPRR